MILYVHPKTEMVFKTILPMSLPALINRLDMDSVVGRFHNEWTDHEVKEAKIIIMDIHWYLSIPSAIRLSFKFKLINKNSIIIAGGLSASIFSKEILRDSAIDYIVLGDGEKPLYCLIKALLTNKAINSVPNIAGREFISDHWYSLTSEDMDESNYRNISFFPSMEKKVFKLHDHCKGRPFSTFPFLVVFRGCTTNCNGCYGAKKVQLQLFKRLQVVRSAEKVKEDLVAWNDNTRIKFVNIFHDFINMLGANYTAEILNRPYDLHLYYDFYRLPSEKDIQLLTQSFQGGIISLPIDRYHVTSGDLTDTTLLCKRIEQIKATNRFDVRLCYSRNYAMQNTEYRDALDKIYKATDCIKYRADFWWEDFLLSGKNGEYISKQYMKYLSSSNRFYVTNRLFQAGVFMHRFAPNFVRFADKNFRKFIER